MVGEAEGASGPSHCFQVFSTVLRIASGKKLSGPEKRHVLERALLPEEWLEGTDVQAVPVGAQDPPEVVVVAGAGAHPAPALQRAQVLEDGRSVSATISSSEYTDTWTSRGSPYSWTMDRRTVGLSTFSSSVVSTITLVYGFRCQGNRAWMTKAS